MMGIIRDFFEEYPGGLAQYLESLREDGIERRNLRKDRRRMSRDEQVFDDLKRSSGAWRMRVEDPVILTEDHARARMFELHGAALKSVEFDDGLTTVVLSGGQMRQYDEAGRLLNR